MKTITMQDSVLTFTHDKGVQVGPLPYREVMESWKLGKLSGDTFYWQEGMADWKPLKQLVEVQLEILPFVSKPPLVVTKNTESSVAKRVLIVDDDMIIREMIGDLLETKGIFFEKADDIKTAFAALEKHGLGFFDAVITDYQTPGGLGVDLVRWIKQREHSLQVLLLTAKDDKELVKEGLRAGVFDFLDKPLRKKTLLRAVDEAILKTGQQREERSAYMELIRIKLAGRGGAAESLMTDLVHRESSVSGLLAKLVTIIKYSEELEKKNAEISQSTNVFAASTPFQGQLADLSLLDLMQLLSQASKTGELQVVNAEKEIQGRIYFDKGSMKHALSSNELGRAALSEIMVHDTGTFFFYYGRVIEEQSLFEDTTAILLSISSEMDEKSRALAA